MIIDTFNKSLVKAGQRIIIYGAGRYGELAYYGLKELGLSAHCFVDVNLAGDKLHGLEILPPSKLEQFREDILLIASLNCYSDMVSESKKMGVSRVYNILSLLKIDYDVSRLSEYLIDEKCNYQKYQNVVEGYVDNHQLVINHCELVVTEKCSLKCKDCANLIQYYCYPEHISYEEIVESFDLFLNCIDKLLDLRLLGGEPFLYPELSKIIDKYKNNDKVNRITIYTNATVLPSKSVIESLKNCDKIMVHVSNYGEISRKIYELEKIFKKNHIEYYTHIYEKWSDMGDVLDRGYSVDEIKSIYKICRMGKCYTFYRGKMYLCPRAAHGERLGLLSNNENEVIDFGEEYDVDSKREEIERKINSIKYLTACNFCNGSGPKSEEIDAAVQMEGK